MKYKEYNSLGIRCREIYKKTFIMLIHLKLSGLHFVHFDILTFILNVFVDYRKESYY